MRSALEATQFLLRYQQLMGAVARRQISTAIVDAKFADAAHSTVTAHETARAIATFAQSFARHTFLPSDIGAAADDAAIADEPADGIAALAISRNLRALDAFTMRVAALAHADASPGSRRRALTRLNIADTNHQISDAANEWFTILSTLELASARALSPVLLAALRETQPVGFDGDVIELTGPIATHAVTRVTIENTRDEPAAICCAVSDVRRADGVGPAFLPAVTISPPLQQLGALRHGAIDLSLWLDGAQFDDRATYVGALSVLRDGGPSIDIPLRIITTPAQA